MSEVKFPRELIKTPVHATEGTAIRETLSTRDFNMHLNSFDGGGDVVDLTPQNVKCLNGEHEIADDSCVTLIEDRYPHKPRQFPICKHCRCLYSEK